MGSTVQNEKLYDFLTIFVESLINDDESLMTDGQPKDKLESGDIKEIRDFVERELKMGYVVTVNCYERKGKTLYAAASWKK